MMVIAILFPKVQIVKNFVRPLFKKGHFRTRFDSQNVKMFQILAKPPWEHFYHVFSSFCGKLILKMSPLVVDEILGGFVSTLTADGKYHVQDWENFPLPIQMQLSQKRKTFSEFYFRFRNLHQIWNILKSKMMVITNVFPILQTVKNFVRPFCKNHFKCNYWKNKRDFLNFFSISGIYIKF